MRIHIKSSECISPPPFRILRQQKALAGARIFASTMKINLPDYRGALVEKMTLCEGFWYGKNLNGGGEMMHSETFDWIGLKNIDLVRLRLSA